MGAGCSGDPSSRGFFAACLSPVRSRSRRPPACSHGWPSTAQQYRPAGARSSLAAGALPSLQRVTDGFFTLQAGSAAAQRLQDVLVTEPEPNPGANPFRMERELRLENATFQWSSDEPLLRGTNLTAPPGADHRAERSQRQRQKYADPPPHSPLPTRRGSTLGRRRGRPKRSSFTTIAETWPSFLKQ